MEIGSESYYYHIRVSLIRAFKFEEKWNFCICHASEDYFFLLIKPLIIINANVLIKRAKMAGQEWEKWGGGGKNLSCLQFN